MKTEEALMLGVFLLVTITFVLGDDMKVIIAGSRHITDYNLVHEAVKESDFKPTMIVSGGAKGVDTLGDQFAKNHQLNTMTFLPRWDLYGRAAGPKRNGEMAEFSDALIAIWDGKSRGTKNMIKQAEERGLKVYVKTIP